MEFREKFGPPRLGLAFAKMRLRAKIYHCLIVRKDVEMFE